MTNSTGLVDTDLKAFVRQYLRAWPLLLAAALALVIIVILLVAFVPARYTASSSILIETPMRYDDPNRMIQEPDRPPTPTDKNYYTNEKLRITSQPILAEVVKQLGLTTEYYQQGLIDNPVYPARPIIVEIDSTRLPVPNAIPQNITFYITRLDGNTFHIEGDGKYGPTRREIDVDRQEQWGQWFMLDSLRLRVDQSPRVARDSTVTTYGFRLRDPRDVTLELMGEINSDFVETDASTVLLSFVSAPSARAIDILNAVGNAYVETHMAERRAALDHTIEQVNFEISHNLALLSSNSDAVESFRAGAGVTDVGHEKIMLMERSEGLDKQRENLIVKDKYYAYLQKLLSEKNTSSQPISPKVFGIQDPILNDMTEQLISLQSDIAALKTDGKTAHPYYAQMTQRLEQQRVNILKSVQGFQETNNMLLASVDQQYGKLASQQTAIPRTERELDDKERDARTLETQHSDLLTRLANLRIARSAIQPEVRQITPAYLTSLKPSFPNIFILAVLAVLLCLLSPFGYLVIKSLFSDRIQVKKDLARILPGSPVLGFIPYTALTDPDALIARPGSAAFLEISKLALGLEMKRKEADTMVTVISNANDKGSAGTIANMLASVLAQRGNKTLLVGPSSDHASRTASSFAVEHSTAYLDKAMLPETSGNWGSDTLKQGGYSHVLVLGPNVVALPVWAGIRAADQVLAICEFGKTRYAVMEELALARTNGQLPEIGLVVNKVTDARLPYFGFFGTKKEKGFGFWGALKYNWRRAL